MSTSDNTASRNEPVQRLYIPAAYVDEIVPRGRASPNAWIGAPAGDVWFLATEEDCDLGITLTPGDVIEFEWVERLGSVRIEIREDGTYIALDAVPIGVTHFTAGLDVVAETLDDFVREWRKHDIELDDDRLVRVDIARWSDGEEHNRFEVTEGGPLFVPVGSEQRGLAARLDDREKVGLSAAARDVLEERHRQVATHGYTPKHDNGHGLGELGLAAALYALPYDAEIAGEKLVKQDDHIGLDIALDVACGWSLRPEPRSPMRDRR